MPGESDPPSLPPSVSPLAPRSSLCSFVHSRSLCRYSSVSLSLARALVLCSARASRVVLVVSRPAIYRIDAKRHRATDRQRFRAMPGTPPAAMRTRIYALPSVRYARPRDYQTMDILISGERLSMVKASRDARASSSVLDTHTPIRCVCVCVYYSCKFVLEVRFGGF